MIDMNILDNILSTAPPFPLLLLESLLKALHIFIGGFIQFDVQYRLTLSLTFEHPLPFPLPLPLQTPVSVCRISDSAECLWQNVLPLQLACFHCVFHKDILENLYLAATLRVGHV